MSERMTDTYWTATKGDYWGRREQEEVARELDRARASEAGKDKALQEKDAEIERLTRERDALAASRRSIMETVNAKESRIQEKDATIKALADALEKSPHWPSCRAMRNALVKDCDCGRDAALRLAGRLP